MEMGRKQENPGKKGRQGSEDMMDQDSSINMQILQSEILISDGTVDTMDFEHRGLNLLDLIFLSQIFRTISFTAF